MINWLGFGDLDLIPKVTVGLKLYNLSNGAFELQNLYVKWQNLFLEQNKKIISKSSEIFSQHVKCIYIYR